MGGFSGSVHGFIHADIFGGGEFCLTGEQFHRNAEYDGLDAEFRHAAAQIETFAPKT